MYVLLSESKTNFQESISNTYTNIYIYEQYDYQYGKEICQKYVHHRFFNSTCINILFFFVSSFIITLSLSSLLCFVLSLLFGNVSKSNVKIAVKQVQQENLTKPKQNKTQYKYVIIIILKFM